MFLLPEVKRHYGKQKLFINGEWVESKSTAMNENSNPATGEIISEFPTATEEEARAAVEAAHEAFKSWRDFPMRDRARLLFDMRGKFEEHFDELCRVLTQDHGRTIGESEGSVRRVIENIETKDIMGSEQSFYVIKILGNNAKIMIPENGADSVGLREVISEKEIPRVYEILRERKVTVDRQTWNKRYKEYWEKIKT